MKSLVEKLKAKGLKIAAAESLTGGLIAKTITDVSGASEIFELGVVSYSNRIKNRILNVSTETLERFGAVSEQTAKEMALGVLKLSFADIAVSATGVAGPGESEGKAVGTVFVGVATKNSAFAQEFSFSGNRDEIRNAAVKAALEMASEEIEKL